MSTRRAHKALRKAGFGVIVAALLAWTQGEGAAASGDAAPTDICVIISGSNGQVGGLQMDLSWDPACMTVERRGSGAASCNANPSTGKNVQTSLSADGSTIRALFFSVSDTNPIPDDELFCCKFKVARAQAGSCCAVDIGYLILAGPAGGRVYDQGISVQALVGGVPCAASAPGGSAENQVHPPPAPGGFPAVQAPVVSAPGAVPAAPGGEAPAQPFGQPQAPVGALRAPVEQAPEPGEEMTPGESATQPVATRTSQATMTAPRTPTPATATPQARTPRPEPTASAATTGSATPQAPTQTPAPKAKKHQRKRHSS